MQLQKRERKYPPPPIYKLTFSVTPTGSEVTLKENDANGDPVTGSNNVFSNLLPGNYYYSVSATGYTTKTGTVEITDKDVTQKVDLTLITYTLTFNVTPTGSKVELKENDANGDPVTGSDNVFSNLAPGNYYYSVSATGYTTKTGTVEITDKDVTQKVDLTLITYTLTFNVTPTGSKVELKENDANGDPVTGSDNVFSNLAPGNYYYSASKTGYVNKTGTVNISNADKTENITLEARPNFIEGLSLEQKIIGYRWVYFETKAHANTAAFSGKVYFLLKKAQASDADKPTANDMKTHPNRMNRTVTVAKGNGTDQAVVTKNYTGLAGDATVTVHAEKGFDGAGMGDVLDAGANYNVWVMAVENNVETDIKKLGSVKTSSDVTFETNDPKLDINIRNLINNFSPIEVGEAERMMLPFSSSISPYLSARVWHSFPPNNFYSDFIGWDYNSGAYDVHTENYTHSLAIDGTKTSTKRTESDIRFFKFVFFPNTISWSDAQRTKDLYCISSTEKIQINTIAIFYIDINSFAGYKVLFNVKKVP